MPSPVGHALAGLAAGWIIRGVPAAGPPGRPGIREAALFAALGVAPDLDLLFGIHSGPTHGVGVAVLAGLAAWVTPATGRTPRDRVRLAVACVLAYASHILLDWLGTDSSAPIGIMALWPFSTTYYESGLHVFPAVSRRFHQPDLFWAQNVRALLSELLVLGPIVMGVWFWRRRNGGGQS